MSCHCAGHRTVLVIAAGAISIIGGSMSARAQDDFDRPPIAYAHTAPNNPVSRLQDRLSSGDVQLSYEEPWGYLRSILAALDVPQSSQMLVFSKTSLQRHRINPRTPRAIYFNDDLYIGYCCNGELLEFSVADPQLGTVFYTVKQQDNVPAKFNRQNDNCLVCHAGGQTRGVPGHLFRSMYVNTSGQPMLASGSFRVDHTSPIENRWGGWYVTGKHGTQTHLGNLTFRNREDVDGARDTAGLNLTDLGDRFNTDAYLTSHSDLVALMVLGHQAGGHNVLTKALYQTRTALHREAALNRELNEPEGHRWDSTNTILNSSVDSLVNYFLFCEEAKPNAPLEGSTDFAKDFAARGPRDRTGRSLRDFDLQTRLFKHPCSYLIYTESFDALPDELRQRFWTKLKAILNEDDATPQFAHLTPADRQAIREILCDTKPEAAKFLAPDARVSLRAR